MALENMSPEAIGAWNKLTEMVGRELKINSAYRDPEHNKRVGGAKNSQHIHGNAFDIDVRDLSTEDRRALIRQAREAGFKGIGVYNNSLHFDVGPERMWGPDYTSKSTPEWALGPTQEAADMMAEESGQKKPSRLFDFADSADREANGFMNLAATLVAGGLDRDLQDNTAPQTPQLGFGSAVPQGASPFIANGMPEPIRMGPQQLSFGSGVGPAPMSGGPLSMGTAVPQQSVPGFTIDPTQVATYSPGTPVASTSGPAIDGEVVEDDPERRGFLERIGATLFPDAEDKKGTMKDFLGGLGVAMGQMSAGMPVDLQPYFANVHARRQAIIEGEQQARQDAIDNEIKAMNADTARMNAELARSRLEFDIKQFDTEQATANAPASGLDPALLERYADDEALAPFISMMASDDKKMRETGIQGFKEALLKRTQTGAPPGNREALGNLLRAFDQGDMSAAAEIIANNDLGTEDIKRIADIADPGQLIKNARALAANPNMPPEVVEKATQLARLAGGVSDSQVDMDRYKDGRAYYRSLLDNVNNGRSLSFNLSQMRNTALDAAKSGKTIEGIGEDWIATALNATRRALPVDWQNRLEGAVGVDLEAFQKMDALGQFIVLEAARPLMKGQGTVTDSERKALAGSLVNIEQNFETQMAILDRLMVLSDIDTSIARYYNKNVADEFHSNTDELQTDITLEVGSALDELYKGRIAYTQASNFEASDEWRAEFVNEDGTPKSKRYAIDAIAPKLTRKQYNMFKDVLENQGNIWFDVDTQKYMLGDEEITFN